MKFKSLNNGYRVIFGFPNPFRQMSRLNKVDFLPPNKNNYKPTKRVWSPFETLRFEGENQPVIVEHQVSYVQSLSVLAMLQERDKTDLNKRETLFAMGAPIYQSAEPPIQAFSIRSCSIYG